MKKIFKRFIILLLFVCMCSGVSTINVEAASKLSTPKVTLSNVSSTGKIKISWKSVKNAVSYKVYRSTDGEQWTRISTTKKKSMTNTSAVAGTTYYYKVRAIAKKSSRNSEYSEPQSIMCKLARPSLSISGVSETGKNKISWKAVSKAAGYEIYRSEDSENWNVIDVIESTSYIDESAEPGVKYYYKAKALAADEAASSALSTSKFRTCDLKRPVVVLSDDEENGRIKVTWDAVEGATSYKIYRSRNKDSWTRIKTTDENSYVDTGASRGKKYYYKVKAVCSVSAADSAYSQIEYRVCAKAPAPVPPSVIPPDVDPAKGEVYYVVNTSVNIYEKANSDSKKTKLEYMTEVQIGDRISKYSDWYKVYYNGQYYYAWIPDFAEKFTKEKSTYTYKCDTKHQQDIVDLAVDIALNWDTEYVHGESKGELNENGKYGFDCSGFASYVLDTALRKEIPCFDLSTTLTTLYSQEVVYNDGFESVYKTVEVELEDIQPGDIIFFDLNDRKSGVDHCAVYLGNNEYAHSTESRGGACIMPLTGNYYEGVRKILRFVPAEITAVNETVKITGRCNLYSTVDRAKDIGNLYSGDKVTVIFNGNGDSNSMAYVRTSSGKEGFVRSEYLDI